MKSAMSCIYRKLPVPADLDRRSKRPHLVKEHHIKGQAHEEHLRKMIAKTIQTVEAITSAVPTVCNRNLDRLRAPRRRR
jgi:hypothetical protein